MVGIQGVILKSLQVCDFLKLRVTHGENTRGNFEITTGIRFSLEAHEEAATIYSCHR